MNADLPLPWSEFLAGRLRSLCLAPDGRPEPDAPTPRLLLPGSFNPLHAGHLRLGEVAASLCGAPASFELSVVNADKPPLPSDEVRRRAMQFANRYPLWLTWAPTFLDKARLFPGATFVVGQDTAARIVVPRFYGGDPASLTAALGELRSRGCSFLVAGRVCEGRFLGLADIPVPPDFRDLFRGIPESEFRVDLSSTALRAAGTGSPL